MNKKLNQSVVISLKQSDETIQYAGSELVKYFRMMSSLDEEIIVMNDCPESIDADFEIGLFTDFSISPERLEDLNLDDAIHIEVNDSKGIIAGSNPRSVLFAIYRFLEENGCRWIRPGTDGDYVPKKEIDKLSANISEKAFYRFRGSDTCGDFTIEDIIDKIEWFPKVGMNMIFNELFSLQFGWYSPDYPTLRKPGERSDFEIEIYMEKVIKEIKKRGLLYHAAGHGWTGKILGLSDIECGRTNPVEIDDEKKQYLAMVNGKREVSRRGAVHTDLCYSNPKVRKMLVQCVADYAESHPEIDFLHFWLCDGMNINCQCGLCRDIRPADFYVMILNSIDEELSRRGIDTRIVFLIYQVLVWPPLNESIKNTDRFVMMFAPARRDYRYPYTAEAECSYDIPYVNNNYSLPSTIEEYISSLKGWQKVFRGAAFAFDYHMIRYHYFDPGYFGFTKVLAEDIRKLPEIGLDGCVSCQILKVEFPTGYPAHLHAKLLWNPGFNIDKLAYEYFKGAFGNDGEKCIKYMKDLSEYFFIDFFYRQNFCPNASEPSEEESCKAIKKLSKVPNIIESFRPLIEKNLYSINKTQKLSWEYLFTHIEFVLIFSYMLRARAEGIQEIADMYWAKVVEYFVINEKRIKKVFDSGWFFSEFKTIVKPYGVDLN